MAKKVVASLQKRGAKGVTKIIKMVKSPKTGAYIFKEKYVATERAKEELKKMS
jgi:Domain of unknown function (DUF4295)